MAFILPEAIEAYAIRHTHRPDPVRQELERVTTDTMNLPQMLTGPIEGQFLKSLVCMSGAKRILEVGMFTGYATLSMAEGLPPEGTIITCEIDPKSIETAKLFFSKSPHGKKIDVRIGDARKTLKELDPPFDFVFIDADKTNYPHYYEEALRLLVPGKFMALDNMLWSGKVLDPQDDETRVLHQLNEKISSDSRVESVLLTVRDGIQLVRKISEKR